MKDCEFTLSLTSRDPCRTALVYAHSSYDKDQQEALYTITTDESSSKPIVSYKNSMGVVFATLEWRMGLPDRVQIGDREKVLVGKWLRKSGFVKKPELSFQIDNQTYTWKVVGTKGSLQLYSESDPNDAIAEYQPFVKGDNPMGPDISPATIQFSREAMEIQDYVVLSAMLIDKARTYGNINTFAGSAVMFVWGSMILFLRGLIGIPMTVQRMYQ